jgi:predicted metal-dependent hydrolase
MNAADLLHAFTKMHAIRRLNRHDRYERQVDDILTKLAVWHDAEGGSEKERVAFAIFLAAPLPAFAYQ